MQTERVARQGERIAVLERAQRSLIWGLALAAGGLLSAFLAHIFGS